MRPSKPLLTLAAAGGLAGAAEARRPIAAKRVNSACRSAAAAASSASNWMVASGRGICTAAACTRSPEKTIFSPLLSTANSVCPGVWPWAGMVLMPGNSCVGPSNSTTLPAAGTWGVGSVAHLAFAMLEQKAGIELHHVPYQGGAPTYAAILGGHVDLALAQVSWATASAAEGKVQLLGVTSRRRSPLAPELPSLAELGFSGYAAEQWLGLFAPKGTPRFALDAINGHVNAWLATPHSRAQLAGGGVEATGGTAAQLTELQRADIAAWGKVIKDGRIRIAELR